MMVTEDDSKLTVNDIAEAVKRMSEIYFADELYKELETANVVKMYNNKTKRRKNLKNLIDCVQKVCETGFDISSKDVKPSVLVINPDNLDLIIKEGKKYE